MITAPGYLTGASTQPAVGVFLLDVNGNAGSLSGVDPYGVPIGKAWPFTPSGAVSPASGAAIGVPVGPLPQQRFIWTLQGTSGAAKLQTLGLDGTTWYDIPSATLTLSGSAPTGGSISMIVDIGAQATLRALATATCTAVRSSLN